MSAKAREVVIDENKSPERKRGIQIFSRRQKPWNQADNIAGENINKERPDERIVNRGIMLSDDVLGKFEKTFRNDLEKIAEREFLVRNECAAGLFHFA